MEVFWINSRLPYCFASADITLHPVLLRYLLFGIEAPLAPRDHLLVAIRAPILIVQIKEERFLRFLLEAEVLLWSFSLLKMLFSQSRYYSLKKEFSMFGCFNLKFGCQLLFKFILDNCQIIAKQMDDGQRSIPNQQVYLNTLFSHYQLDQSSIKSIVSKINEQTEKKIQHGQYSIEKKSFSLSALQPYHRNYDINHLVTQRRQLLDKRKDIDSSLKKQGKCQTLSDAERIAFLKRMKEQHEFLQMVREKKIRMNEFKVREQEEEKKLKRQREEKERQAEKRYEIQSRLQELQEKRQRRSQQIRERNKEYQQVARAQTLMHRIQQNYYKVQLNNLLQKKRKLAEIRQLHKPMSKTEFEQHLLSINEHQSMHNLLKNSVKDKNISLSPSINRFYQSHWYREVLHENKIEEDVSKQQQKQFLKQLKDRQKKYSEYIKRNFVPDPDEELIKERLKRKPQPIKRKKANEIRSMGLQNLKICKQKIMSKEELEAKKKQIEEQENKLAAGRPKNYLQELKNNRRSSSVSDNVLTAIDKKRVTQKQKLSIVKTFAEQLQRKTRQREKLHRMKKNVVDPQLDDLYMDALKVKLQLLIHN